MNASPWIVGGGSRQGAAHKRRNQPNQDALRWVVAPEGGVSFAAAVADGHGGEEYYRSDVGASLAVTVATETLARCLAGPPPNAPWLLQALVEAWRQAVQRHATQASAGWVNPESGAGEDSTVPYGTTLVASAISPDWALALQIGDGDLYWGFADGQVVRTIPEEDQLVGEQTRSLCLPDAVERTRVVLRLAADAQPLPDFALLSTDGLSKSFATQEDFRKTVAELRAALRQQGAETFASLPLWLDAISERGSGDDVTLCLASLPARA